MRFSTIFALSAASMASAATFNVLVGDGGLKFNPTTVTAAEGDVVTFEFMAKNHTLTQSTFAAPCEKMTTPVEGIDSGYVPVAANATEHPVWSLTINNASAPLWFYCAQASHCTSGMVFAINPTAERTFEAFQATAMGGAASSGTSGTSASASGTAGSSATDEAAGPAATGNGATTMGAKSLLMLTFVGVAGLLL